MPGPGLPGPALSEPGSGESAPPSSMDDSRSIEFARSDLGGVRGEDTPDSKSEESARPELARPEELGSPDEGSSADEPSATAPPASAPSSEGSSSALSSSPATSASTPFALVSPIQALGLASRAHLGRRTDRLHTDAGPPEAGPAQATQVAAIEAPRPGALASAFPRRGSALARAPRARPRRSRRGRGSCPQRCVGRGRPAWSRRGSSGGRCPRQPEPSRRPPRSR